MRVTTSSSTRLRNLLLRRSVPYGLLAAGCALAIGASWYVEATSATAAETRARAEFVTDAQETRREIQTGLNSYIEVVRAGGVLLSSDNEIQGSSFRRFVDGLQLRERYPGMEGIGFAQCVARGELRRFLRLLDLDGNPVRVWPAGERPHYCPVVFFEPTDEQSKRAVGFDLASSTVLQETMLAARDSGAPMASRKVTDLSIGDDGWHGNVLLFIPIYRSSVAPQNIEQRRRAFVGFAFSPFDSRRLLDSIVSSVRPAVGFEVYDGNTATPSNLLAASTANAVGHYQLIEPVQVAGRDWLVAVKSVEEPVTQAPQGARQLLIGGIILAFMLFLVTRAQVEAWETAARHEQELRESALALRESEAQARAANRAKDEFLATLSHELRTPLNVVLGWVNMLRHGNVFTDRVPHALEMIERNARQQAALIEDLLDVSRIVTGKLRLDLTPVALPPIVSAVIESLRPSADAKRVSLTGPAAGDDFSVLGDADRLRQASWNLLSNAIKFTPSGGTVTVELTRDEHHVRLAVRDSGIGIAPEFLPHVFERFRQADSSTTREHTGVGLGLAITRHLVELHGGTIEARSDGRDRGATFIVTLRAAPAQSTTVAPVVQSDTPAETPLRGVRVLVVDDDPATLEMLTTALGTTGADVTAADSARRALERFRREGADVIVSDIAMPGEDGFWLMQRIRELPGERGRTPAIALTALARREERERAFEAGYQMHMAKPVEWSELKTGLATLVGERSSH